MKHRIAGKKLGRNIKERKALFNSQVRSVFINSAIETTEAKAKAVIPAIEKLGHRIIKSSIIPAQRELNKIFNDRQLVSSVYKSFMESFKDFTGRLTKVEKVKIRKGDDAVIVKLSFVKPYTLAKAEAKKDTESKTTKPVAKKSVAKKTAVKKVKSAK